METRPPFENGVLNLQDYEIVPEVIPPDETPRQFVLRVTGRDFPDLSDRATGRDFTWEDLRSTGVLPRITRILELSYTPRITLRKKER